MFPIPTQFSLSLKLFFCGFLFLQISFLNAQLLLDAPVFKGKVKSIVTTTSPADTSGNSTINTSGESFNENGQYTESWYKNERWRKDEKVVYVRDGAGNVIKSTSYSFGKASAKASYKYNANNKLILSKDSYGVKFVYVYDEKNNCIKEEEYEDGKLKYITTKVYDEKNRCVESSWSDAVNTTVAIVIESFKYDDRGNIIELKTDWTAEDNADTYDHTITKKYDASNHLTSSSKANTKGKTLSATAYRYDKQGSEIEMIVISVDLTTDKKTTNKYTYEYEYDPTGNWLKKKLYTDGVLDYVEERVITYY